MDYLFAYGTLLDSGKNEFADFLRKNSNFVGEGHFQGRILELGDYPGAINSNDPTDRVKGKIFKIEDVKSVFHVLDEYEGAAEISIPGNEYIRRKVPVQLNNGGSLECWVYLYQPG